MCGNLCIYRLLNFAVKLELLQKIKSIKKIILKILLSTPKHLHAFVGAPVQNVCGRISL